MKLPLFPLNTVLFPGMALPLHIFEPRYREMIGECLTQRAPFGVVLIRAGQEAGATATPHLTGTLAIITKHQRLPDGRLEIETVGQERFHITALHHDRAFLTGTVEMFPLLHTDVAEAQQAAKELRPWLALYLSLLGQAAGQPFKQNPLPRTPAALAYLAAIIAQIPLPEKQMLLNAATAFELLDQERWLYRREAGLMRAMLNNPQAQHDATFSPN